MTCCAVLAIFIEELRKPDLYDKVSQAFTVFLPVRSVGVMGDGRKYDWVVSACCRNHRLLTAHWAHLPYDFLGRVSSRIINEVKVFPAWCMTSAASRQRLSGNDLNLYYE